MSLLTFTPEIEAVLRGDVLEYAHLVDLYLDSGTRHYWSRFAPLSIDDGNEGEIIYQPVGDRLIPPSTVSENQSLEGGSLEIRLDSSRINAPDDFLGGLMNENLLQRPVRIRSVLFEPGTHMTVPIWIFNTQIGLIDGMLDTMRVGAQSIMRFKISSGTFAYLERRQFNYTDTDQRPLHSNDTGLTHLPQLVDVSLPWGGEF